MKFEFLDISILQVKKHSGLSKLPKARWKEAELDKNPDLVASQSECFLPEP